MQNVLAIIVNLLYFFGTGIVFGLLINRNQNVGKYKAIVVPLGFIVIFLIIAFLVVKEPWMMGMPLVCFFVGNSISYMITKRVSAKK